MCGIVGKLYFSHDRTVDETLIHSMADRVRHRGPDAEGYYCHGPIGLGFRRLAIIDLSPAGNQPMMNEDGTVRIIFNGEIYNFQELRPDLEHRGHRFRSHTDSECILHLYEEYGERCLQYLRGMFAFAIWDSGKQKLFLARDRVGKKPLKYFLNHEGIVFASELKAILGDPSVPRDLDDQAIHHYLMFQYVPHPMTGFQGIKKLPAGHYLTVDLGSGKPIVRIERYWRLDFSRKQQHSEAEWQELILKELETSVKLRMISDVPLGAFLSGGTDSSAIVAMMAKNSSQPVKTFSIGFLEEAFNELPYARMVAKQYATDHQEFILKPAAIEVLPKLVYHYEEPYADSSALPTYYLSEMTRQHVTVALNGDGGDENFGGYPWYRIMRLAALYRRVPRFVRQMNAAIIAKLHRMYRGHVLRYGVPFTDAITLPLSHVHAELLAYFNIRERQEIYNREFRSKTAGWSSPQLVDRYYQQTAGYDPAEAAMYADIHTYLADDLLVKVDIASMAVSLEARSPLLDHKLVELAASIPANLKVKSKHGKYIFKKALERLLPPELLYRKKKGFSVPIDTWFRNDLRQYARDILLDKGALARNIFDQNTLQGLLDDHQNDRSRQGRKIWLLLTMELWYKQFFSQQPPYQPPPLP